MDDLKGSYNKTFELSEVGVREVGGNYQIPRAELSKSQNDPSRTINANETLSNGETYDISSVENGISGPGMQDFAKTIQSKDGMGPTLEVVEEEDYSLLSFFDRNGMVWSFVKFFQNNCKQRAKYPSKILATIISVVAYIAYFVAVIKIKTDHETKNYWCDSDGLLIILNIIVVMLSIYFVIIKPFVARKRSQDAEKKMLNKELLKKMEFFSKLYTYRYTVPLMYLAVTCAIAIFLLIDTVGERSRLISVLGMVVFILFGFLFSAAPRKIVWRHVIWGMGLQFALGLMILRWPVGRDTFRCLADKIQIFLSFTDVGSSFLFGKIVTELNVFSFKVLSVILFFSLVIQILYYYGVMQWLVLKLGWVLQVTVGTTACESVNAAANIFLGMAEAPMLIKPYIPLMTKSELHAILTGGFATIAGSMLAAYVSFGVNAAHLLSASVMSAPAALAYAKLFYPEVEASRTKAKEIKFIKSTEANVLHAALEGVASAIPLVSNIVATLIAFIAFIALVDALFSWPCDMLGLAEGTCTVSNVFGYVCMPLAWLMGVPWDDCYLVGQLIGTKTIVNEFVAYINMSGFVEKNLLSPRAVTIATYALCGFSNIPGIGIQLAILGAMAPERRGDLSRIIVRAMISGTIACFLTACVAGTLISTDTIEHPKIDT